VNLYKTILRPFLFLFYPETSHSVTAFFLKTIYRFPLLNGIIWRYYRVQNTKLEREVAGIKFPNPVGLAAGFDKDAKLFREMEMLGFGFVEVGTVTPTSQSGNIKPRLFRLKKDSALINRMGFNNDGAEAIAQRLENKLQSIPIGCNIGKNKITPNDKAIGDYETCFKILYPHADFFVVNVSSPNTQGLREMQDKEPLEHLLTRLQALNISYPVHKPVFLKIAPDLTHGQLDDIIALVIKCGISGVVATNTTLSRDNLIERNVEKFGAGGLSGKPLKDHSTEVVRYLYNKSGGAFPIIASGGIHSVEDAMEKFDAGASLLELYTGFIYEGPRLVKKINTELVKKKNKK
jgi:dihydroorotate dehydrogenase